MRRLRRLNRILGVILLVAGGRSAAQEPAVRLNAFALRFTPEAVADVDRLPLALRQPLALRLEHVTVGRALREIIMAAHLDLSYSGAVVPLERTVTVIVEGSSVAEALRQALGDAPVELWVSTNGKMALVPIAPDRTQGGTVAGRVTDAKSSKAIPNVSVFLEGTRWRTTTSEDGAYRLGDVTAGTYSITASRIGYSRQSQSVTVVAGQELTVDLSLQAAATELEQVVVTGTVTPTEEKAVPTPISVITGDEIEQRGYQRVDQIFRGDIPGTIAWNLGPENYHSAINIRGATAVAGIDNVKTYIDGVEVTDVANIATIDPSSIERIEVLRGPQGSTIYGSQALEGVMQIFTKQGAFNTRRPRVEAKVSAGVIQSQWDNTAHEEQSLAVSGGGADFAYRLGGGSVRNGNWVPGAHSTNVSLYGNVRGTQGPVTALFSARYYDKSFATPNNPDLAQISPLLGPTDNSAILRQQTYGLVFEYAAMPRWQHKLILGYDRNGFDFYLNKPAYTTPADSFLSVYSFDEAKASVAYNTTYGFSLGQAAHASLTAGADHWTYQQSGFYGGNATQNNNVIISPANFGFRFQYDNTGGFAQAQLGFSDAVFLTAGLRAEDNQNFGRDYGLAWAPRAGLSYLRVLGNVTAKARLAYGKALRPPSPGAAGAYRTSNSEQVANPNLAPSQQVGPDGGLELYFGQRGSLEATYYHQTVTDLIDFVTLSASPVYTYQAQNVGRIKNRGWELRGRLNAGSLSLTGTYSITTSLVEKLSPTYSGDLKPRDQLLHVPKHTAGATLSYNLPRTAMTLGMTYIGSWIETDYVALYGYYYGGQPSRGSGRAYWITYPSFAKFNLSLSHTVTDRIGVFLQSDNLTNKNATELNNLLVKIGRTTTIGVRTGL